MEGENRNGGGGVRPLLLVLLPAIFFALFLFSSSFKGFRSPILIKSGWDALNFLLVLLAILCGLFGRNNNEDEPAPDKSPAPTTSPLTDHHSQARSEVDSRTVGMRRMRSSSSYPDLRQEAWWGPPDTDTWRFSDDIQLYRTNQPRSDHQYRYRYEEPSENPIPLPTSPVKTIPVDTLEIRKSPPPPPSPPPPERFRTPPPPPPPPPPMTRQPRRRTVKKVAPAEEPDVLPESLPSPLPEPENPDPSPEPTRRPPPPPPPPPPPMSPIHVTIKRMEGKKSSGAKDIAAALAQFYQKKKKKSKVKKIYDDDESVTETGTVPPSTPPPPPPPPPPPASSMFQQLFKKNGSKSSKRHHHHSFPPPPPPPPPAKKKESAPAPAPIPTPLLPQNLVHKRRHKPRSSQSSYPLPPSPLRPSEDLYRKIERISPSTPYYSIPMPPPPPPPPPSNESEESNVKENGIKEGEEEQQQFCPSPDVNNKAEMFIARFRAGLKLEKLNSIKLKEQQQQQQQQEEEITTAT